MKKLIIVSAAALSFLTVKSADAQIGIHVNLHFGVRPVYAPAPPQPEVVVADDNYANDDDFYYLPDVEAYYDVNANCYYYQDGDRWISAAYLPGSYHNFDWRNARRFEIHSERPFMHHDVYRSKFGGFRGDAGMAFRNQGGYRGDDRRFDNHGPDNRGFENRGFDNRGHGQQGFDNRGPQNRDNDFRGRGGYGQSADQNRNQGGFNQQPSNPNNGGQNRGQGGYSQPSNQNNGQQGGQGRGQGGYSQPSNQGGNSGQQGGQNRGQGQGGYTQPSNQNGNSGQPANQNRGGERNGSGEHFSQNVNGMGMVNERSQAMNRPVRF